MRYLVGFVFLLLALGTAAEAQPNDVPPAPDVISRGAYSRIPWHVVDAVRGARVEAHLDGETSTDSLVLVRYAATGATVRDSADVLWTIHDDRASVAVASAAIGGALVTYWGDHEGSADTLGLRSFRVGGAEATLTDYRALTPDDAESAYGALHLLDQYRHSLSTDTTRAMPTLDFETLNPFDGGDTGSFDRVSGAGRGGSYAISRNATANKQYLQVFDTSSDEASGPDFLLGGWVRTDPGYSVSGLSGLCFGIPTSGYAAAQGYQVIIDVRVGSPDFQIRRDFISSEGTDSISTSSVSVGDWIYIEIAWGDGTITASFYADDAAGEPGTLLETVTREDATYTHGHVGVAAYSLSSFDDLVLGVGTSPVELSVPTGRGSATGTPPQITPTPRTLTLPTGRAAATGTPPSVQAAPVPVTVPTGRVTATGTAPTVQHGAVSLTLPTGRALARGIAPTLNAGVPVGTISVPTGTSARPWDRTARRARRRHARRADGARSGLRIRPDDLYHAATRPRPGRADLHRAAAVARLFRPAPGSHPLRSSRGLTPHQRFSDAQ